MAGDILLVEDEPMLQIFWEDVCAVSDLSIGLVAETSADALDALKTRSFTGVVLDINLVGETSESVAEYLQGCNIPVIVSTGSDPDAIPEAYRGFLVVQKPFRILEMSKALESMKTIC